MSMQMDVYLKKEQTGTLFVLEGAPEGGYRAGGGGGQGGPPQNVNVPSKKNSLLLEPSFCAPTKYIASLSVKKYVFTSTQ